jgi:hypothetical protein
VRPAGGTAQENAVETMSLFTRAASPDPAPVSVEVNEEALRPFIEGTISMAEFERRWEAARPALIALMCPNSMSNVLERDADNG